MLAGALGAVSLGITATTQDVTPGDPAGPMTDR
jgi:hypothetical protein